MDIVEITSKIELEHYFNEDGILLHLYELGDLDDFFWSRTRWFALQDKEKFNKYIILVYSGVGGLPVVIAHGKHKEFGLELFSKINSLPEKFYSHLSVGLSSSLWNRYQLDYHGLYLKMGLIDSSKIDSIDITCAVPLVPSDLAEIESFYSISYPGNWFDSKMLESLQTFGIYHSSNDLSMKELVAVAGIHVFSKEYKVAALGNIAVHPSHRNKKYAQIVTAALVNNLLSSGIIHIGLNVSSSNIAAISCYKNLGFEIIAEYEEIMWEIKKIT